MGFVVFQSVCKRGSIYLRPWSPSVTLKRGERDMIHRSRTDSPPFHLLAPLYSTCQSMPLGTTSIFRFFAALCPEFLELPVAIPKFQGVSGPSPEGTSKEAILFGLFPEMDYGAGSRNSAFSLVLLVKVVFPSGGQWVNHRNFDPSFLGPTLSIVKINNWCKNLLCNLNSMNCSIC